MDTTFKRKHQTLAQALAETKVVKHNGIVCRYWPDGVGVGVRPRLSNIQKTYMNPVEIMAYLNNKAAYVPETTHASFAGLPVEQLLPKEAKMKIVNGIAARY